MKKSPIWIRTFAVEWRKSRSSTPWHRPFSRSMPKLAFSCFENISQTERDRANITIASRYEVRYLPSRHCECSSYWPWPICSRSQHFWKYINIQYLESNEYTISWKQWERERERRERERERKILKYEFYRSWYKPSILCQQECLHCDLDQYFQRSHNFWKYVKIQY